MDDAVLAMLAQARASSMPTDEVIVQLANARRRHFAYLARREHRGTHTAYDDALEADMEAMVRAIVLLESSTPDAQPTIPASAHT